MVALIGLLAASADAAQLRKQLAHASIDHGACRVERGVAKHGNHGIFQLACDRGTLEASLELDASTRQLTEVTVGLPREPGATCR